MDLKIVSEHLPRFGRSLATIAKGESRASVAPLPVGAVMNYEVQRKWVVAADLRVALQQFYV